jgi:hypothetical protein
MATELGEQSVATRHVSTDTGSVGEFHHKPEAANFHPSVDRLRYGRSATNLSGYAGCFEE